ncbi:hypothetical protein LINPERHAP1_LOCUS33719 [Linum perenne]
MLAAGDFLNQSHSYPERIRPRRKRSAVDGVVRRRLEVR